MVLSFLGNEGGSALSVAGFTHVAISSALTVYFLRNAGGSDETYKENEFKLSKAGLRGNPNTSEKVRATLTEILWNTGLPRVFQETEGSREATG